MRGGIVTYIEPLLFQRLVPGSCYPPPDPKSVTVQVLYIKWDLRTSKMAQWVKAVAAKPNDLNSVVGIHMVGESSQLSFNFYVCSVAHVCECTHISK